MNKHDRGRLASFARAFRKFAESEHVCKCGVIYRCRRDFDYEDTEDCGDSVAWVNNERIIVLNFEAAHYADCCQCWYPKALKIMDWLEGYGESIVKYFQAERQRKQEELEDSVDPRKHYHIEHVPEGLQDVLQQTSIREIDPSDLAPS